MKKTSVPIYGTKEQTQALLDWLEENREMPGVALPALQKATFFALWLAHLRRTGRYAAARRELLPLLEPEERELLGDGCTLPALMAWARREMAR